MAISKSGPFISGTNDVNSAGTAEQLYSTAVQARSVTIIAHDDNAGRIFYGGSDVDSSTQKGLNPGDSISFTRTDVNGETATFDASEFYVDSATSSDGVDWIIEQHREG